MTAVAKPKRMPRSSRTLWIGAAAVLALLALGACEDETKPLSAEVCPNKLPGSEDRCDPGLKCVYVDDSGCAPEEAPYFHAECTAAGRWSFDYQCQPTGGAGGVGGKGGGGAGASGGMGGAGGDGPCVDPQPGAPTVTSELSAQFPPDASEGFYRLQFSEEVDDVAMHVSWDGPGKLDAVTKAGAAYNVYFSGLSPGESATLNVVEVPDSCGTAQKTPAAITIGVRASCHYLGESFAGALPATGWSLVDSSAGAEPWRRSDLAGVDNHALGSGSCATANDAGTSGVWDSELRSPAIDLSDGQNAVLKYRSDFHDALGGADAWLDASLDGTNWTTLSHFSADRGPSAEAIDLTAYVGSSVYLRWRYKNTAATGSWWDVDDVCVEEFTKVNCPCPAGGYNETSDIVGSLNGNGTLGMAENTLNLLSQLGNRVTVCGVMEGGANKSGADFFGFVMDSGTPSGAVEATVNYCLENAFESATSEIWVKTSGVPLASVATASKQGSYEVQLVDGEEHFISLAANSDGYKLNRYAISVEVKNIPTPLITDGFEVWPPSSFTISDDDPCLNWAQSNATTVPPGILPPQGQNLAYFNSFDCNTGSESLVGAVMNLVGKTSVTLTFDMFHDTGYANSLDEIQVEFDESGTWIPIGAPFVRPGAVEMWESHTLDLNALAGKPAVRVRLKATTQYGNNIHIDNVLLVAN